MSFSRDVEDMKCSREERRGFFVSFEGVEGSGKSTQCEALAARLTAAGKTSLHVREPGGTAIGEQIRDILSNGAGITPYAELFLFSASRALLIDTTIGPALANGVCVVCDRYIDSTIAYQGYGRGIQREIIDSVNQTAVRGISPDLTILLDISPTTALRRKNAQNLDRFEREDQGFHNRVREGYLELAEQAERPWIVIDGSTRTEDIATSVWDVVKDYLPKS